MNLGTRLSGQRSGAEAAFQCGQRNSLKTINVDGEHFIRFRGKSCVFKFIRLSVDVAFIFDNIPQKFRAPCDQGVPE